MINYTEFLRRHDFDEDDINILKNRYKNVKFANIPLAWCCIIDDTFQRLQSIESISKVEQHFGIMTFVFHKQLNCHDKFLIQKLIEKSQFVDFDLYEEINTKPNTNLVLN